LKVFPAPRAPLSPLHGKWGYLSPLSMAEKLLMIAYDSLNGVNQARFATVSEPK